MTTRRGRAPLRWPATSRPDGAEPVGHDQAARHAVPQRPLDVVGQAAGGGAELAGEAGTALAQHLEHLGGGAEHGFAGIDRSDRAAISSHGRSSRNTSEIGVAFDGATAGASASSRGRGVSRSQATSPSWHSRSSQAGS